MCVCSVTQLCLTLCNPMDCSLPGSSIHGIPQERILEWVAMSSSGDLLPGGRVQGLAGKRGSLHWTSGEGKWEVGVTGR